MPVCIAWSMRGVIDAFITQGYQEDEIIGKFAHGFGEELVKKNPAFDIVKKEYPYLLPKYTEGFGTQIHSTPQNDWSLIPIGGFIIIALIVSSSYFFIRKRSLSSIKGSENTSTEI